MLIEPEMEIHTPEGGWAWYNTLPLATRGRTGHTVFQTSPNLRRG